MLLQRYLKLNAAFAFLEFKRMHESLQNHFMLLILYKDGEVRMLGSKNPSE